MTTTWADRLLDLDGRRVHVRLAGPDGDPVVVLHDAGAESVDAPAWDLLAAVRPVAQVLLPGVGDSDPPPRDVDVAWVADHVAALVDALCAGPAVLVGTSIGGWFAVETALAHPDRVAELVLLDAAGLHAPPGYLLGLFADGQGQDGQDGLLGVLVDAHGAPRTPQGLSPYVADMTAAAMSSWNPWAPHPSLLARAAVLDVPTTVMWGERDGLIPVTHGRALADAIPGARWVLVPDAGHLLAVDAPQVVARRLGVVGLPSAPTCPSTPTD